MNFANVTDWQIPVNGVLKDVIQVSDSNNVILWKKDTTDYTEPFYVENTTTSNQTLSIKKNDEDAPTLAIYKSTDKLNWSLLGYTSTTAITLRITPSQKVYLRCNTNNWSVILSQIAHSNQIFGVSKVGGNIMSLLYGSNFTGNERSFPANKSAIFKDLFYGSLTLTSAKDLILPATTLYSICYSGMFERCQYLLDSPKLPATSMANGCYNLMFSECYRLTNAPNLPALTLAEACYSDMFYRCSTLTKAPYLPAETIPERGYYHMFWGCISLNEIKCMAKSKGYDAVYEWVAGVPSTGTFTKAAGAYWSTGTSGIPSGWTVQEV